MTSNVRSIAKEAGVSPATVSRVLNNVPTVDEALRARVQAVIDKQKYLPNSSARSLSTSKQEVIAVILPDMRGYFFPELIKGLDEAAQANGYHILLSSTRGVPDEGERIVRSMYGRVDGFVLVVPELVSELMQNLSDRVPTVWVNHLGQSGHQTTIMTDNYGAACTMTEHLYAQNRHQFAFIEGPENNYEAQERRRGFLSTIAKYGLAEPLMISGDFSEASGFDAAKKILKHKRRIDAVFAANDMMAMGCLFEFNSRGVRVPQDIILAGFDDIPVARFIWPPLTTIRVEPAELGRRAVELLLKKIDQKSSKSVCEIIEPQLIARSSTQVNLKP